MDKITSGINFFIALSKVATIMDRHFDRMLGGISFNEFLILWHLREAPDKQLRRIDLADKIGLTASGVTRLLLPMEKVHFIKSGPLGDDARSRSVQISAAGNEKLDGAIERFEYLTEELLDSETAEALQKTSSILLRIGGRALMS